jgi:hypothetical protein
MAIRELDLHPSTPCPAVRRVFTQALFKADGSLALDYVILGDMEAVALPEPVQPRRADELWRHTCLEAFLTVPGIPGYLEFNFSPSGEWAVYRFTGYREGMAPGELERPPSISVHREAGRLELNAAVHLAGLVDIPAGAAVHLGLTAVVEARDGAVAYWALAHPPGKPDFHAPQSFALTLTAP